ncbi:hypothetical protein SFUMM280S_04144 [Streptomyces fumanus]
MPPGPGVIDPVSGTAGLPGRPGPWRPGNLGRSAVSLLPYGVSPVPWCEGRDGMYGWIWRHLPGNAWVKALISLVLALAVVYVLFQYVFPWAEPLLPFNDVTVDNQ